MSNQDEIEQEPVYDFELEESDNEKEYPLGKMMREQNIEIAKKSNLQYAQNESQE